MLHQTLIMFRMLRAKKASLERAFGNKPLTDLRKLTFPLDSIFVVPSKHLVPLPDPKDRSTFPATDYAAGSQVMAVYPDTTSLYHGKVVGLPGGGAMQKVFGVICDSFGAASLTHLSPCRSERAETILTRSFSMMCVTFKESGSRGVPN